MSGASYAAFLAVSLLVICTPGQDTALTIRNTLLGGRRSGVATAAGVSSGQAVWTLATSAGLAVILVASGPLFLAVRLAGAAYLIYLGVRSLVKAATRSASDSDPARGQAGRLAPRTAFWQGLLSNLSNAKMVACRTDVREQYARKTIHKGSISFFFPISGTIQASPAKSSIIKSYCSSDRKPGALNSETLAVIQVDRSVSKI